MGRLVAQKLGEIMGGTSVVDNRSGASGAIGTQCVAQQPPDGYMAEAGYAGIDVLNYFAPMAPIGTPLAVIEKINLAINKLVALPEVVARFKTDAV